MKNLPKHLQHLPIENEIFIAGLSAEGCVISAQSLASVALELASEGFADAAGDLARRAHHYLHDLSPVMIKSLSISNRFQRSKQWIDEAHGDQKYGNHPYSYHLQKVFDILLEFGFDSDLYLISGYGHDVLEDTKKNFADLRSQFGSDIAEVVYAVTDELGRTRKERKAKTYPKIRGNSVATTIKLADRLANIREGAKIEMYVKEHQELVSALYVSEDKINQKLWEAVNQKLWEAVCISGKKI